MKSDSPWDAAFYDAKAIFHSYLYPSMQSFALRFGLGARTLVNAITLGSLANYNINPQAALAYELEEYLASKS